MMISNAERPALRYEGRYVVLERMLDHHCEQMWPKIKDDEVLFTFTGHGPFPHASDFYTTMDKYGRKKSASMYAIIIKSDSSTDGSGQGDAVGYIVLEQHDDNSCDLGPVVYSKALQRTCAATEAVFLLMQVAFDTLHNDKLWWKCKEENVGSQKAARRLGFQLQGLFASRYQFAPHLGFSPHSTWFAMTRADWHGNRTALEQWLAEDNFDAQGRQRRSLLQIRQG